MANNFIDILEQLEKTTGTNDKIELIKENKDNVHLKNYLKYALDKNVTFGIVELPEYSLNDKTDQSDFGAMNSFMPLLNDLANRNITGTIAKLSIVNFMTQNTTLQDKWFRKLLQKDLASIGIGQRLFEQAYDEKGFKFRLMLAAPEADLELIEDEEGWLDKKANGVCTIIRAEDAKVEAIFGGRNGLIADNFYFLQKEIEKLCAHPDVWSGCIFHGETHVNDCLEDTMSLYGFKYRTIEEFMGKKGLKEKAWADYQASEERINKFKADAKYVIFEQLTLDEWDTETCTRITDERKAATEKLKGIIKELGLTRIEIIETEKVKNQSEAIDKAQGWIKRKFEGGVYKRSSGVYEWRRSRNAVKIKEVVDFEIEFDSFEIQKKKYNPDGTLKPPMAGKVWGHDANDNQYKVGTGKALSEPVRIDMLNNWDTKYKGKIGTCSAQRPSDKGKYICARLDIIRLDRNSLD